MNNAPVAVWKMQVIINLLKIRGRQAWHIARSTHANTKRYGTAAHRPRRRRKSRLKKILYLFHVGVKGLLPVNEQKVEFDFKRRHKCKKIKSEKFTSVCKEAPTHLSQFACTFFEYFCEVGKLASGEPETQVCDILAELLRVVTILGHDIYILLKCLWRFCQRHLTKNKVCVV